MPACSTRRAPIGPSLPGNITLVLFDKGVHKELAWQGIIVTRLAGGSTQGSARPLRRYHTTGLATTCCTGLTSRPPSKSHCCFFTHNRLGFALPNNPCWLTQNRCA